MKKTNLRKSNNKLHICSLLFAAVALFLTGCESIPPGTPPEGPIVSVTTTATQPLSVTNALNNMTTATATCPLLYLNKKKPVVKLYPIKLSDIEDEYKLELNSLTTYLYRNLVEIDMIDLPMSINPNDINFLLVSDFSRIYNDSMDGDENLPLLFKWKVKLVMPKRTSEPSWEQSLIVKLERKKTASTAPSERKSDSIN
jgi:hypothetical protein